MTRVIACFFVILTAFNAVASDLSAPLMEKLAREQADYEKARVHLIESVESFNGDENEIHSLNLSSKETDDALIEAYERHHLSRGAWEKFFSVSWTEQDQKTLRSWHQSIVAEQRQKAREESWGVGIDFNELRGKREKAETFCRKLPKRALLHVHPYGTLDRATVVEILDTINPMVDREKLEKYIGSEVAAVHVSELAFLRERGEYYASPKPYSEVLQTFPADAQKIQDLFFMPADASLYNEDLTRFERFLGAFAAPLDLLGVISGDKEAQLTFESVSYNRFFERSIGNGVYYVELTRNLPTLRDSFSFDDRYQELLRWTQEIQEAHILGAIMYPRTLLSFDRKNMLDDKGRIKNISNMTKLLASPRSPLVVGINLMGSEDIGPALETAQFIYGKLLATSVNSNLDEMFLQPTMHAGELGDVRNLRDALIFGVRRVGHGVKLIENPIYLEMARRQGVAIEANLVSNEILGIVPVAENPFLYFFRLGIPVSLSTDDEGMFNTDISKDCARAIADTDIEYSELRDMMINAVATSFADPALKAKLLEDLEKELADFEAAYAK